MKKIIISAAVLAMGVSAYAAAIEQVIVRQQWPWSTDVKIEYRLSGVTAPVDLTVKAYNGSTELALPASAIRGDLYGIDSDGVGQIVIDPVATFGTAKIALANFKVKLSVSDSAADIKEVLYKIFDLTTGGCEDVTRADLLNGKKEGVVTDYTAFVPDYDPEKKDVLIWAGVTNDVAYMKDKLVLRRVKANTFAMGSPTEEKGRGSDETRHNVTLQDDYFIGVFEVTQYQYYLVKGTWPSKFSLAECRNERPVENISFENVRGGSKGIQWPSSADVDGYSFIGTLRSKLTGSPLVDLPTEAQWENACRAGTTTAFYSGKNTTKVSTTYYQEAELDMLARYNPTAYISTYPYETTGTTNGTARVGSYLPNANGLYDMLGNVPEWCLDRYATFDSADVTDPKGGTSGIQRIIRGGSWCDGPYGERAATRGKEGGATACVGCNPFGFRVCLTVTE